MGAGGSTAASCSSLDLGNGSQVPDKYRYYRQQGRHQQYLHKQRLQKCKRQAQGAKSGQRLKQSSSQFDLTSCDTRDVDEELYLHAGHDHDRPHYGLVHPVQASKTVAAVYNLTNSDVARPQPLPTVMVLPPLPADSKHLALGGGAKKSNAGVASRILHQRQQQQRRSSELKRFSDSLPSLNNILATSPPPAVMAAINHHQHQPHQHPRVSQQASDCRDRTKPSTSPMGQSNRSSAIQAKQQHQQQLLQQREQVTKRNLVLNEPHRVQQSHLQAQPYITHAGSREPPQSVLTRSPRQHLSNQVQGKHGHGQMKRATSLSSLHNLNQSHHRDNSDNSRRPRGDCHHNHQMAGIITSGHLNRSSANLRHIVHDVGRSPRPPSLSSCSVDLEGQHLLSQQYQYQQQRRRAHRHFECDLNIQACEVPTGGQYRLPPQIPPPKQQIPTSNAMVSRKNHKYKQAPSAGAHLARNNKYKTKLQQQQQHQTAQPQNGCPVLPPMPRSQSLHELIQLRATENGQRMRTTGTLRGPFGNGEQANKVNLVAELLESRRQQRQTQEDPGGEQKQHQGQQVNSTAQHSETLLSQSSSTDDGIHDVSITGKTEQVSGHPLGERHFSQNNRSSTSSQEYANKRSAFEMSRQRAFKRQNASISQAADRSSRQKLINDSEQDGKHDRAERHHQARAAHKFTLKRSASHSALHYGSCNISDSYDQDGDESDDLNELARFLYQFKQRQVKNQAAQASKGDGALANGVNSSSRNQISPSDAPTQGSSNYQQSPNSTTSSSGFASSTCTSHSASSGRDKFQSVSSSSSQEIDENVGAIQGGAKRQPSPKKYPAPPRPGESRVRSANDSAKQGKNCPASGKLVEASSSLLSIVDECLLPTRDQQNKKTPASNSKSGDGDYQSDEAIPKGRCDGLGIDDLDNDQEQDTRCEQRQLERLRNYTNMRQMARSELALNHLTSAAALDSPANRKQVHEIMQTKQKSNGKQAAGHGGESNGEGSSSGKKPYTNRLFNLIRRISDKSEAPGGRDSCRESSCGGRVASASERRSSGAFASQPGSGSGAAGGQYGELNGCRAIDGRQEINQKSEMMNFVCPNKSGHSDRYNGAPSGQLDGGSTGGQPGRHEPAKASGAQGEAAPTTGESLCDLNFDCDFELIKKCATAANCDPAGQNGTAIHNERSVGRESCEEPSCESNSRSHGKKNKHAGRADHPIFDPTGRENNNWHLVPTSSLLGLTHFSRGNGNGAANGAAPNLLRQQRTVKHNNDNYDNSGGGGEGCSEKSAGGKTNFAPKGGSSSDVRGVARGEDKPPTAQQQRPGKLKWSASSWFLGSGGSGGRSGSSKENKKGSQSGLQENNIVGKREKSKPAKEKGYLARLLPTGGGGASSSAQSRSKQADCDNEAGRQRDMISEADQLLVELDQSLDLVSGSSRRRRTAKSYGQQDLSVPWWQQVSGSITEEEALMMHRAQLNAISGGDESLASDSDDEEANEDDDDELDNDDADYASINRALLNETFDVDLSGQEDSNHLNLELAIEQAPGSPSDSFTFSAPSSPLPPNRPPQAFHSGEIVGGVTTNGLSKQPGPANGDLARSEVQDKHKSSPSVVGGVVASCSSKFTHDRSAKTTTTTKASSAALTTTTTTTTTTTGKPASIVTNEEQRGARGKLGGGACGIYKRSNLETQGVSRPVGVSQTSGKSRPRDIGSGSGGSGRRIANQMAEAAGCKKPLSADNKIVARSENSDTFTKVTPQGVAVATPKRHPCQAARAAAHDGTGETISQVVRDGRAHAMMGVARAPRDHHAARQAMLSRQTAAVERNGAARCTAKIVRRDNDRAHAGCATERNSGTPDQLCVEAKKSSPMSGGQNLNVVADKSTRYVSNDVIGPVADGNKITHARLESECPGCQGRLNDIHLSGVGARSGASGSPDHASSAGRRVEACARGFNDPSLLCPIHGQTTAICSSACCCAHSSTGQGETEGNLKQQQQRQLLPRDHVSGQCQLDTNSAERRTGYGTGSDNERSRGNEEFRGLGPESPSKAAPAPQACECVRAVNGSNGACGKLACHRPVARENGSSGDNGSPRAGRTTSAAAVARTKTGHQHKGSVVCDQRAVTAGEAAVASGVTTTPLAGESKLIIRERPCACDASDPPNANEKQRAQGGSGPKMNDARCCAATAEANGCARRDAGKANGSADCDSNTSPAHRVTYCHCSPGMKNFAPISVAPNGELQEHATDSCRGNGGRGGGGGRCGRSGRCKVAASPGMGGSKVQQQPIECACMISSSGASGGNNSASENEISCSDCPACKTACHYHLRCNSSSHEASTRYLRHENEDVKVASCCSHNDSRLADSNGPLDARLPPGKNKALVPVKPMTAGDAGDDNDDDSQLKPPAKAGNFGKTAPAMANGDGRHCCRVAGAAVDTTGAAQTNGQVAACLAQLQSRADFRPENSTPPPPPSARCNPICRSNSELTADTSAFRGTPAGHKKAHPSSRHERRVSDVLFSRLRNSLLNQRGASPMRANQRHLLNSSQLSLGGHYVDGCAQQLIQSMLLPSVGNLAGVGSSPVTNDLDDNFILKRKTPNAGLKSRC